MHTEHAFDTPGPTSLYVENASGSITVTAVDVSTTKIDIRGRRAEEVVVEQRRDQIAVVAPKQRGVFGPDNKLDIEITLPAGSDLFVKSGSADVRADGSYGATSVKSGSGDVTIDRLTAAGVLSTGSGAIAITEAGAEVRIKSGSGDVVIERAAGDASVSTGSGDVEIRHSAGQVVAKTGSGDLVVGVAEADVAMTTGSGDLVVRTARRGKVTLKGASGDLRLGIPAGTPVWTDIRTVSGRVSSSLESVGEPEPGGDYVEVRATTASGDVELAPA